MDEWAETQLLRRAAAAGATMAEIGPRWGPRSFGHRFGPAERRLAQRKPGAAQDSGERYLLCGADAKVKLLDAPIRDFAGIR